MLKHNMLTIPKIIQPLMIFSRWATGKVILPNPNTAEQSIVKFTLFIDFFKPLSRENNPKWREGFDDSTHAFQIMD